MSFHVQYITPETIISGASELFDRAMSASNGPALALEELLRSRLAPTDLRAAIKLLDALDEATIMTFETGIAQLREGNAWPSR